MRSERGHGYVSVVVIVVAMCGVLFAAWTAMTIRDVSDLRTGVEERVGWLRAVDGIERLEHGSAEATSRLSELQAEVEASDAGDQVRASLEAALAGGDAELAEVTKSVRDETSQLSEDLAQKWETMAIVSLGALLLALFAAGVALWARRLMVAGIASERALLEQRVVANGRLAAIGTLSASLAHELRTPLQVIVGNVSLLGEKLAHEKQDLPPALARFRKELADIGDAAARAAELATQLQTHAHPDDTSLAATQLEPVIRRGLALCSGRLRGVAVQLDLSSTPPVHGNARQLEQVVVNLVSNAARAIRESERDGTIHIRTRASGEEVQLIVEDDGPGIPEKIQQNVREPFVTTGRAGETTGLGLYICDTILSRCDARMDIDSRPGRGTTINITLRKAPGSSETHPTPEPEPAAEPPRPTANESALPRLLIVDDEPSLTILYEAIMIGHAQVSVAHDGQEALELIDAAETPFDVILCDLDMPRLDGLGLIEQLVARDPANARHFVICTGGARTPKTAARLDELEIPVMEKPFDAPRLRTAMAEAFTRAAG